MDTSKHIAIVKAGEFITVRVLAIHYDMVLKCNRECSLLQEDHRGSIQCATNDIGKLVNFQAKTLLVDYEVILDKHAHGDDYFDESKFKVIDQSGHIHEGKNLCNRLIDIEKGVDGGGETLYPGTRCVFRIHYDKFPANQKITSIILEFYDFDPIRINLDTPDPVLYEYQEGQEQPQEQKVVPVPTEIYDRLDKLEKEVASLRRLVRTLTELKSMKEQYENDPTRPMHDPGIGYHPLDNK